MILLPAIPLIVQLVMPVADKVPELNVGPSCNAAATRAASQRTTEACLRSEQDARDQTTREWAEFAAADRDYCVKLSTLGGMPSYVELLTCLEMARDVRTPAHKAPPTTTGQATPDTRR